MGWEIDVDEESFQRFQTVEGDFGERLRSSIETDADGCHHYRLKEGDRCPFLNDDGLCEQILHCGEDILCEICAQHPRFFRTVWDTQEWGVGLACPEAARLLLSQQKLSLTETVTVMEDVFLDWLLDVRDILLETAQNDTISIHERLGLLLDIANIAQEQIDWGELDADALLPDAPITMACPSQGMAWLEELETLEPIDREWSETLADALNAAEFPEMMEDFADEMAEQAWEQENFLVYLLFRYFLKVYDDRDLLYWVKTAVWMVLTAEILAFGRWLRNGQVFSLGDHEDILRSLSKEVEYDPDIIEGLDGLMEGLCEGEDARL